MSYRVVNGNVRIVNGNVYEDCFYCGKELQWTVDNYTFDYAILEDRCTHKVVPFCHRCLELYKKEKEPKEPEQLTLFLKV